MSRCIICDYSQEIDGPRGRVRLKWDDKEQGHVCTTCLEEIADLFVTDAEEGNDFPLELGGSELLVVEGVVGPPKKNAGKKPDSTS